MIVDDSAYRLDAVAVRRAFARTAPQYDTVAAVPRELGRRMSERLDYINLSPKVVLDIGCGTGDDLRLLATRYPHALSLGCDIALPMLQHARRKSPWWKRLLPFKSSREAVFCCADVQCLPIQSRSVNMVWSNFALNWATDPLLAFRELHRVMETGGLLLFAMPGPDTLKELRQAFSAGDDKLHVQRFVDMHDWGDMLVAAGFSDPVMEMEPITVTYPNLSALLTELRVLGGGNLLSGRSRGMTGRRVWERFVAAYEAQRCEGLLPVTIEVVYGHAWKAAPRVTAEGRSIVQFHPTAHR